MRVLHRASPWRELFAGDGEPEPAALLAPLRAALDELGPSPDLPTAHAWQLRLVEALQRLDLPAWRISQLISDHNDLLYRRAIQLSLNEMQGQGWGSPPVAFCVLTLGSAGRHESLLAPDQDNAMIVADYPDARHSEIDGFFQALGERFTTRLDEAGIPLCNGHVMARWPMWRKRLSEWCEQLTLWTRERRVKRVQQSNILLDFHPVFGDANLADALAGHVAQLMPRAGLFLDEMAQLLDELPVALDRFGRLSGDDEGAPHENALNLKRQGLLPLVNAVRLLSLRHGVRVPDTRRRLSALVLKEALTARQARAGIAALDRLQERLLTEQSINLKAGGAADGWIDVARLEDDHRLLLRHDMQAIRSLVRLAQGSTGR
ncbi:MAG: DUF294 nucleotidyltransferase-like domain-containing protein [Halomonas sp.]|jgi:CBS domain-containing protein|uniref:DUF294 nucleotidyltransferase-like domain-containing protein n=1 Tax=Halomonas sp. MCCC 1A11057 TaxID=2733482 RepID=UPI001F37C848|nr:DUF294 nucleotidyltransferase-like domain-containing protein [Halomonas sp. MCCC 1A11057]MCE8034474.1 signal transduction protein [Halomonas sp. MCCC 1A11057]MDX5432064.1 DUF294 nucleotidyltransferase-like domain-containing protein [Halomonas sp.]